MGAAWKAYGKVWFCCRFDTSTTPREVSASRPDERRTSTASALRRVRCAVDGVGRRIERFGAGRRWVWVEWEVRTEDRSAPARTPSIPHEMRFLDSVKSRQAAGSLQHCWALRRGLFHPAAPSCPLTWAGPGTITRPTPLGRLRQCVSPNGGWWEPRKLYRAVQVELRNVARCLRT